MHSRSRQEVDHDPVAALDVNDRPPMGDAAGGVAVVLALEVLPACRRRQGQGSRTRATPPEERPEHLRNHAWFVGFAPRVNPEVALAVLVEHGGGGGQSAAPIAGEIFKTYLEGKTERKNKRVQQASLVRN